MSENLPILWEDKINSPELKAYLKQFGKNGYMTAEEVNQLRDAVNEMSVIQKSTFLGVAEPADVPTGTGRGYWEVITAGPYPNHGRVVLGTDERGLIARDEFGAFKLSKVPYGFSNYATITDLKTKTEGVKNYSEDGHYFTDKFGNVMFIISINGSQSSSYDIINPSTLEVVVNLDKSWIDNLNKQLNSFDSIRLNSRNDGYFFTDYLGNVIAKLTKDGFQSINFLNKLGEQLGSAPKKLDNKTVVSIGDSHATSEWLTKFCSLTGSTFNSLIQSNIMNNQYSYVDSGLMMGIAKSLNQYSIDNSIVPDVILIENCHFASDKTKNIKDYVPMIYDNLKIYGTTYASYSAFLANINADKTAFISSLVPTLKTALRFNFSTFKNTITFSSSGTLSAGTIQLTINGSVFPVNITSGMTLSQAVTKLNDWSFNESVSNWTNSSTKGAIRTNAIELIYTGTANPPTSPTVSFSAGTTGMTMTTNALSSTTGFQDYYFNSLSLSDWNNSVKWLGQTAQRHILQ